MPLPRITPSKILFFLCLSFVAGIFFESVLKIPQIFVWGILILGIILIVASFLPYGKKLAILGFCFLFLVLGVLRMQISEFKVANNKLLELNGNGQVVLTGFVSDEPEIRETTQKIKVEADEGKILLTTSRYPEYKYLDEVKIGGELEIPLETEDFSYKNYLMKDGIYSVAGFPEIEILGQKRPNFFEAIYSSILAIKQKLRQSLQNNFLPPESFILQGIVLGDKTAIPQDIKTKLSVTGVSHIIAVSGTHVVILTAILMAFLLAMGFYRGQAFYVSVIFICFYIVLVGLPASGVRAGIMGILYLLAQKLGRQGASSRIIALASALMLLQNPMLLVYDVGFQLSFLAVLGLIWLEPLIRKFVKFLIEIVFRKDLQNKYDAYIMIFSATISAQIFTLPVMVYNFGNISFVSPVANILILPIVPEIMLLGFLSAAAGALWSFLGWVLSVPCYFLILYFLAVVNFFSKSWAYKMVENVHWSWLVMSYLFIGASTRFFYKRYKRIF